MKSHSACNLIIDSCCDLPAEVVAGEGIDVIEFPYISSKGESKDDFFQSISAHDFYEAMRKGEQPSTAQVPVPVFKEVFTRALESGIPTVYLSFTSGLSGSFDTACLVADALRKQYPHGELYLVDTTLASIAQGLLTYEAIRQRARGLSAVELVEWVNEAKYFINEMFMVDDLGALKRGGRIPASVAFAGSKLDVKPMLDIALDGTLSLVGVARGRKKGIRQMADFYKKRIEQVHNERHRVLIGHSDCPKDVERLKDELRKIDDELAFLECNIGPVIGSHVGPGMLALVFWGVDSRENLSISERIAHKIKRQ